MIINSYFDSGSVPWNNIKHTELEHPFFPYNRLEIDRHIIFLLINSDTAYPIELELCSVIGVTRKTFCPNNYTSSVPVVTNDW